MSSTKVKPPFDFDAALHSTPHIEIYFAISEERLIIHARKCF
jgi:hypothetical protein